ncbi:MAG: helix-turn-helix transcriptional regulator [Gemmatimonadetes bacterium]|nr:helix-turn-helix transcriptional regulator [Gemmatimonadota bacterium]MYA64234.1 helix-turn-helix transcriptional regulator [Gemmatimonadota bacterium]MYB98754.1 helix-turn-helix transcriptional regulator [Gemmatimonadota bacterium]MYH53644.1 helix-turn-helix transcriptional regulator [Gemmatimonadota bacterium]MYI46048.1 helix-turn-helix transcriptional regulator [Gemmatimonadota bacterium]
MSAEDRFERVLENLYRAALADAGWESVAGLIHDAIRTNGHSLTYADVGTGGEPGIHLARFFVGTQRRRDHEQTYFRDYFPRDEAIPRLHGLRDGELVFKSDLYTDQEKKTSAAYNEFRCANGNENGLFMGLDGLDGHGIVLSFGNSTERTGWGHDQIRTVKRLAPHLCQFARVRCAMADARALGASLTELLESRRLGIIQLDRRGRIREANDRAQGVLLKRDGLCDRGGALVARHREEHAELQRLLAQALPPSGLQGAGGSMKITRREASGPLVLEIHPVRETAADCPAWQLGALVLLVDPVARPRVDPDLVATVLGLTPAESLVAAALATGQTVAGLAHAQGCAESTVRTHLKRIYRKLGIRKQTELVRRLMSLEGLRKRFR